MLSLYQHASYSFPICCATRADGFKLFGEDAPYEDILKEIKTVEGVVAHGLLLKKASAAVLAKPEAEPELIQLRMA